jgi:hypothetical protein
MGLFNSNAHGLIELLYEYTNPYILYDSRFKVAFPDFRYTPYDIGIRKTLNWFKNNS